jgi:hypothetical protein
MYIITLLTKISGFSERSRHHVVRFYGTLKIPTEYANSLLRYQVSLLQPESSDE